mgnify:CR=1 FL=1
MVATVLDMTTPELEKSIALAEAWFVANPVKDSKYRKAMARYDELTARATHLGLIAEIGETAATEWQTAANLKQQLRSRSL